MKRRRHKRPVLWLGLILATLLWSACSRPPAKPTATLLPATPLPTTETAATPTPANAAGAPPAARPPSPTATARPAAPTTVAASAVEATAGSGPERSQYVLAVDFDYAKQHLEVTQTITYGNQTGESLTELLLVVEPNSQPDVFTLHALRWPDGRPIAGYTLEGARLRIPLPQALPPGGRVALSLAYALQLPDEAAPFGFTPRQANLGDWYPFIPAFEPGTGWLAYAPAAVGEHLVYDVADYAVVIRLAPGEPQPLLAASAPAVVAENGYRYHLEAGRSFAWSASPNYQFFYQEVGGTTVVSYVFPEFVEAGQAALAVTAEALALYAQLFGPYPHEQLALVIGDFQDGQEYDGLYFLDLRLYRGYQGSPEGWLTPIAAHETSHQWWSALVGNNPAMEPWLDEALATYSELLYIERYQPQLVEWWWEFRVQRFQPGGLVDSTIYDHQDFRPYVNAVYLRGAQFLGALRQQLGSERFLAFLADLAGRYRQGQVTAPAFFSLLEEYEPAGVEALRRDYFREIGD